MVAARALSRSQLRRLNAQPAPEPAHDTALRALLPSDRTDSETAMIIGATEQDFIAAVLADLGDPGWSDKIRARLVNQRGSDGVAELSQPIHQRFHLVLVDASCVLPGSPRLDPKKITEMGLVMRRAADVGEAGPLQAWMTQGPKRCGWLAVGADTDPDPAFRRVFPTSGHAQIDALIAANRNEPVMAEEMLPLFVAPEAVCQSLGKTVLFGLVPVASSEKSEAGAPMPDYATEADEPGSLLRGHLSGYLKSRPILAMPKASATLDKSWTTTIPDPAADAQTVDSDSSDDGRLRAFTVFLQQLHQELGALDDNPTPAAQALMALLATIALPLSRDGDGNVTASTDAATFVRHAAPILLERDDGDGTVMPLEWPAVDAVLGERLTQAAFACIAARFATVKPQTGKLDGLTRQYNVRAFIRVAGHPQCPPKLVWSQPSEPFRILPWYAGDAPPAQIPLPDVADRNVLKGLKPGVSFQLPASLANLLRGDPNDLAKGSGSASGIGLGWLCSFSIPIITICAFIVLNIFLSLFDLIFRWMIFIKICIPIPKRGGD